MHEIAFFSVTISVIIVVNNFTSKIAVSFLKAEEKKEISGKKKIKGNN